MTRLLLADLRRHAGTWVWTAVVCAVVSACATAVLVIQRGALAAATALGDAPQAATMRTSAQTLVAWTISTTALAGASVLTSTTRLAVEQHRYDHGLWRALGMRPGILEAVLLGQLAVLGALAGLLGTPLGLLLVRPLHSMLVSERVILPSATPAAAPRDLLILVAVTAGTAVLGGLKAVHRSARTEVLALLRDGAEEPRPWWRRLLGATTRLVLLGSVAAGVVAAWVAGGRAEPGSENAIAATVAGSFAIFTLVVLLVPWVTPFLENAWTGAVELAVLRPLAATGLADPTAWFLARRSAAHEARRSSTTVMPFLVAIGLVGLLYGFKAGGASGVTAKGMGSMFGPALLTAWTGGVAVIALGASRRRRDAALLEAAGARVAQVRAAQVLEGAVHAVTATLLGLVVTGLSLLLLGRSMSLPLGEVLDRGPWLEVGVVALASLVTTCTAVVLAGLQAGHALSLAAELRSRD